MKISEWLKNLLKDKKLEFEKIEGIKIWLFLKITTLGMKWYGLG